MVVQIMIYFCKIKSGFHYKGHLYNLSRVFLLEIEIAKISQLWKSMDISQIRGGKKKPDLKNMEASQKRTLKNIMHGSCTAQFWCLSE